MYNYDLEIFTNLMVIMNSFLDRKSVTGKT